MKKITKELIEDLVIYVFENEKSERLVSLMLGSNFKYPFELSKCKKYTTTFRALFGKII